MPAPASLMSKGADGFFWQRAGVASGGFRMLRVSRPGLRYESGMDPAPGGDPGWIRTTDPQIRNLVLYPTELRDHHVKNAPVLPAGWGKRGQNFLPAKLSKPVPSGNRKKGRDVGGKFFGRRQGKRAPAAGLLWKCCVWGQVTLMPFVRDVVEDRAGFFAGGTGS